MPGKRGGMNACLLIRALPALVSLLALMLNTPPRVQAWEYSGEALIPLPGLSSNPGGGGYGDPHSNCADLDGDGGQECLVLQDGRANIQTKNAVETNPTVVNKTAWQSPPEWQVRQTAIADLNRDGAPEAALLVWRAFAPWPVDRFMAHGGRIQGFHNRQGLSCHLILIGWDGKRYRELWAGSALAQPLRAFQPADLNRDGWQELLVLETDYADSPLLTARALAAWEWNGFGFSLLARQYGRFYDQLAVSRAAKAEIFTAR